MNVLYVCPSVDERAKWTAIQVRWITTLANMPGIDHVHVLTPNAGTASLPENVTVRQLAGRPWITRTLSLWWEVMRAGPFRQDFFFVVQGGPYPALLFPFKLLTRRPLYQWKAHAHLTRNMRLYARFFDDLVFTATEQSLPMELATKRVVGHGIDTDLFQPRPAVRDRDFITVGRLAPIKRIHLMIEAIAACRQRFGVTPRLDIVGASSREYLDELRALIEEHDLGDAVRFLGQIAYRELPELLPRYRACLNFSLTAFDKTVGEAMACGVPVISSNVCVIESLPLDLHPHLVTELDDVEAQAQALHRAMCWDEATQEWLQQRVRDYVVEQHSLRSFFVNILDEIRAHQGLAAVPTLAR